MKIDYVVSTMVFWWRENHLSLEQECEFLRSLGFGVELWPTMKGNDDCRFAKRHWARLKNASENMTTVLRTRHDGPTVKEWTEQLDCAQYLCASMIADLSSLCISQDLGFADWDFAAEVVKLARDRNVPLCIETGSLPVVLEVGKRFDFVAYCLDTGFANIDKQNTFNDYVDALAEKTSHIHLADNFGTIDEHQPPGVRDGIEKGKWDYLLKKLNSLDADVIGSLEMFPSMPGTMIKQAKNFLFDELKWPNQPQPTPGSDENGYIPY